MQTERVTFLTSADQKAALDAYAARQGQSVGHIVREATARYIAQDNTEEAELLALVHELATAMPDMQARLTRSAKLLQDAAAESDRLLREAGLRK